MQFNIKINKKFDYITRGDKQNMNLLFKKVKLDELTINQIQSDYDDGKYSIEDLTRAYLEQIYSIDQAGPKLNSIIQINPDVIEEAKKLDKDRVVGRKKSVLHGIPILIKDNIMTQDNMATTAGSVLLKNHYAQEDASVIKSFRNAGILILGKTNLSEWSRFRSTKTSSGWSSLGGQTLNPYQLDITPSGSSSGSAVSVSSNLCTVSIGTETLGSIISPASVNGIVGLKPTLGLISTSGVIPVASTDTPGPMARNVRDLSILLTHMVTKSECSKMREKIINYEDYLDIDALKGARLGVNRSYTRYCEQVDTVFEKALLKLKELGAIIIDPVFSSNESELRQKGFELLLFDFKEKMNAFLSNNPEIKPNSLSDLIELNIKYCDVIMPTFKQELFELAQMKSDIDSKEYEEIKRQCFHLSVKEGIDKLLNINQIDAIIAPTLSEKPHKTDLVNGDIPRVSCAALPAFSGGAHITLPMGFIDKLPVGLSFFANRNQDAKLISYAYAFEQNTFFRKKPNFEL